MDKQLDVSRVLAPDSRRDVACCITRLLLPVSRNEVECALELVGRIARDHAMHDAEEHIDVRAMSEADSGGAT